MIRAIDEGLWEVTTVLRAPGQLRMPLRTVIARLADGGLWIHSPIRFDEEDIQKLQALGPLRHVVAPNKFHHLFAGRLVARFPDATFHATRSLRRKRPQLPAGPDLGSAPHPDWADRIDQVALAGVPLIDEVLFFHRPTSTLICTDFCFRVLAPEGFAAALFLRLTGTHGRFAQSRVWRLACRDRKAYAAACARVLEWPIRRVTMGHGEILEEDAPAALRRALAWVMAD